MSRKTFDPSKPHAKKNKAVSLKYDFSKGKDAPHINAKGEGFIADQIIQLAQQAQIPVVMDQDLVELLAASEIGEDIPIETFEVVAEILRYLYILNGRMKELKAHQ